MAKDDDSYREYARKMDLFMDGPTTTSFEQLTAAGVELPPPDSIAVDNIQVTLWEVLAALAERRTYLDLTGHLSDSELYAKLWNDVLREEVPSSTKSGPRISSISSIWKRTKNRRSI